MNRAIKYLLISRDLITLKSLNADSVGSIYFIPAMARIQPTVIHLFGTDKSICYYNKRDTEI